MTVTGLQGNQLSKVVGESSCTPVSIILPPLKLQHMIEIVENLFGCSGEIKVNNALKYLLNSLSGVVKYLDNLLHQLIHTCGYDRIKVRNKLNNFTYADASALFSSVRNQFYSRTLENDVPRSAIMNLVAFAIGEVKINNSQLERNLSDALNQPFTFKDA